MPSVSTSCNLPRIERSEYAQRRKQFRSHLGSAAALFRSAPLLVRSNDAEYRYRQDSDFYYLTGFVEPDAVCLLLPEKYVLFVRPRNKERELWEGSRCGPEAAKELFGADEAYSIDEIDELLPMYLEHVDLLYYSLGRDEEFDRRVFRWLRHFRTVRQRSGRGPYGVLDPSEVLHEMRLYKSSEEVKLIRQAAKISAAAHLEAMAACRPGMYEFEIEAILEHRFRREGANAPAYTPIVGSGPNATILHYTANRRRMMDGDLLLVDAGAEYEYYCADITRTYPVNSRFTQPQRELYELVLRAQKAAIETVRPGVRFDEVHKCAVQVLLEGLLSLGFVKADLEAALENGLYRRYYMHRTSHWLGIDVHDVGKYMLDGVSRTLEPGMVLTVEPGLYIPNEEDVPERYRGLGIRIEDDVLVTSAGREVLTEGLPKEIEELEAMVGRYETLSIV